MNQVYIIAEVGSVHDGSFGNAMCLIDLAVKVGADAVKFQTHLPAAETLQDAPMPPYFRGEPRFEYFARTGFSPEQWAGLAAHAKSRGIDFLSSPFSIEAVDLLESIGVNRYKIPSGEVSNLPMLDAIARTGKPILLSSGMSSWMDLDAAVNAIRAHHDRLCVMQCKSVYPCPPERVGLNILSEMRMRWGCEIGYSDHTLANNACLAAVALGAKVVEKHLTFSRAMYGSDAQHSAEPTQFADLVRGIREIEAMLGSPSSKDDLSDVKEMKSIFEKSVVTVCAIVKGTTITREMVAVKKPGTGISPVKLSSVIGSVALRDIPSDALIPEAAIDWRP
jgi:N,N'-diacetyllegionaminate synthase